jgi:hypothetical protein
MQNDSRQKNVTLLRVLYPVWAVAGMFGLLYVPSKIIVAGDAVATANNIVANEMLFRAGIVSNLVTQLLFVLIPLLLYELFEQTNKRQALLMVILALVAVPIAMLNELTNVAALLLKSNPDQVQFYLDLNAYGVTIASIFWGLWLFPLGCLIYKSGWFPKIIGVVVLIAGVGYTLTSFLKFLTPDLDMLLSILSLMTFGEVIFLLWLVFRGVQPKQVAG